MCVGRDLARARSGASASDVRSANGQSKPVCKGINCLWLAHSVTSSLGVNLPGSQLFDQAMSTAGQVQTITGLGEKAGWANGLLTVLQNNVLYKVKVGGLASSQLALNASELIARGALNRTHAAPHP